MWLLDALKRIEKIVRENAFEQKKKKPRLKFNLGLMLIGLRTTGLWLAWGTTSGGTRWHVPNENALSELRTFKVY